MSAERGSAGLAGLLFRLAALSFPARFARVHRSEMAEAFEAERTRVRSTGGRMAESGFVLRAAWDALRQGLRERLRGGPPSGHGRRTPSSSGGPGSGLVADLRVALRALRRSPTFALAAVTVLALGLGANTTVFSALRAVVFTEPPYPDAERLVLAELVQEHRGRGDRRTTSWSYPKFERFLEVENRLVDPVAAYARRSAVLTDIGPATRTTIELVSPSYFPMLGVTAALGRTFTPEEDSAADPPLVAVLSHELWSTRLGSDPGVLGTSVTVNGAGTVVVGVAPSGFHGLTGEAALWVPLASADVTLGHPVVQQSGNHWFRVLGTLRADATLPEARAQMTAIGSALHEAYPSRDPQSVWSATLRSFDEVRANPDARAAVVLLSAGALVVLLVACANLSGLLLARARRRARDGALRMAIGATRWRIVRASLVESLVLAALGGAAGVLIATWGTGAMRSAWPRRFLESGGGELRTVDPGQLGVDPAVLGFAAVATALTALVFGVAPALRASGAELASTLKGIGQPRSSGRSAAGEGRVPLLGAQVALALVLLVAAGLVGRSTARLLDVELGFEAEELLTFRYAIPATSAWQGRALELHDELLGQLSAIPGVETVSSGTQPLGGYWAMTRVDAVEGGEEIPPGEGVMVGVHMVSDDYFAVLGTPVVQGRALDGRDGTDAVPTIVVSASLARAVFGGSDPIGRRLAIGISDEGKERFSEIVGVVDDILHAPPDRETIPEVYYSYREFASPAGSILARTENDPMAVLPALREVLERLDPTLAVYGVTTGSEIVRASVGDRRVVLVLLGLFAGVAVLLAATGTWGLVAVTVADRRRELGLRMALGANAPRVLAMVVRQSLATAAIGVAVGALAGAATSRLLEAFLWQTPPRDPTVYGVGAFLLLAVVLIASWLPARRALGLDPAETLRAE